jgi:aldose 1-epimerase
MASMLKQAPAVCMTGSILWEVNRRGVALEDPRISRMYAAMIGRAADRAAGRFRTGAWLRSGATWMVVAAVILLCVGVAIREKGRGRLTKIKAELGALPQIPVVTSPQPGGRDPIVLSRAQQMGGIAPEFLSATLLPGRGMNVLQIKAYLPGRGEVTLLDAPSVAEAAMAMSGIADDLNGEKSLAMGGALEAPWAGSISGALLPGATSVLANWQGRGLTLPVNANGASAGGLLLKRATDSVSTSVMPDGGAMQATFNAGSFDGRWPSTTVVKTTVQLSGRAVDIAVMATNKGTEPEPMSIGWRPRFLLPGSDRSQVLLRVPSTVRAEVKDPKTGLPSGRLLPVAQTEFDLSAPNGATLRSLSLNDLFVHLKGGVLSSGPDVELRDPAAGFGIRMTALTSSIKAIHVTAPADQKTISIDMQTSYDDAFGREWDKDENTGLVVLQPGESLQWKVRLELFPLSGSRMGQSISSLYSNR